MRHRSKSTSLKLRYNFIELSSTVGTDLNPQHWNLTRTILLNYLLQEAVLRMNNVTLKYINKTQILRTICKQMQNVLVQLYIERKTALEILSL
jgi:hypothetical protein